MDEGDETSMAQYVKDSLKLLNFQLESSQTPTSYIPQDFLSEIQIESFIDSEKTVVEENGKLKLVFATDGSLRDKAFDHSRGIPVLENGKYNSNYFTKSVSSAISSGRGNRNNLSWRTAMNKSVFNAEIQALEILCLIINDSVLMDENIILIDSLSVIRAVTSKSWDNRRMNKNRNGAAIARTRELLKNLPKVEIIWIPSHLEDKNIPDLSIQKIMQVNMLKQRFGDLGFDTLQKLNSIVDAAATEGHYKSESTNKIHRDQELSIVGKDGEIWEGNIGAEMKEFFADKRKDSMKADLIKKYGPNFNAIEEDFTYEMFKSKDPKSDRYQELLFRVLNGGLKSPNNVFDYNYENERNRQIHQSNANSDICEDCEVLGETSHILFGCLDSKEEQRNMLNDINEFLEKENEGSLNLEETSHRILPWWDSNFSMYNISRDEGAIMAYIEDENEEINSNMEVEMEDAEALVAEEVRMRQPSIGEFIKGQKEKGKRRAINGKREKEREEIKQIIIEKLKIGNKKLKRKREEAEEKRKDQKRSKKSKLTDREIGCKGYVNRTLIAQIDIITHFNIERKMRIIKEIHITFLRYIERMYKKFWRRQYNKLRDEGIAENAILTRDKENIPIT